MLRRRSRRTARPGAAPRPGLAARPANAAAVEHLEDRVLLTTYTVDTELDVVADDGMVSLREAVSAAEMNEAFFGAPAGEEDGDEIRFADGVDAIALTLGELPALTDDLVIDGRSGDDGDGNGGDDGDGGVTITASAGETIFPSLGDETFTFSGLTLTGGTAENGGAMTIEDGARVSLTNVEFTNNAAENAGGALYIVGDSRVEIVGASITGNTAVEGGGLWVAADSAVSIDGTEISGNAAELGGGIYQQGGDATDENKEGVQTFTADLRTLNGAFGSTASGTATLTLDTTDPNRPSLRVQIDAEGLEDLSDIDGAVHVAHIHGQFLGNRDRPLAEQGDGPFFEGEGGVAVDSVVPTAADDGDINIDETDRFGDTYDTDYLDFFEGRPDYGPVVLNLGADQLPPAPDGVPPLNFFFQLAASGEIDPADLFPSGTEFNRDVTYTFDLSDQDARRQFNNLNPLTTREIVLHGLTIPTEVSEAIDEATGAEDGDPTAGVDLGNGMSFRSTAPVAAGAIMLESGMMLNDVRFTGNTAADSGGGVYLGENGAMIIASSVFTANIASGEGAETGGGGIYNDAGRLTVRETLFDANEADGGAGSGGAIHTHDGALHVSRSVFNANLANRAGGAIEVDAGGESTVSDSRFTRNAVDGGEDGEDSGTDSAPGNGGAIHVTGADASTDVRNTYFALNTAANQGGALWNAAGSDMRVADSAFSTNTASGSDSASGDDPGDGGGAIYAQGDGELTVTGSQFFRNAADGEAGGGGAILSAGGNLSVADSVFNMNFSDGDGAAIHVDTGDVLIEGTRFTRNMAGTEGSGDGCGGVLYNDADAVVTITGGVIAENFAALEGGAVWNSDTGVMRLQSLSVARNVAAGDAADQGGGAVYNENDLRLDDVFVNGNRATGESGSGGGILSRSGVVVVENSNLARNFANRAGGGIELVDGDLRFDNSFLRNNVAGGDDANPGNGGGYHVSGEALAIFTDSGVFNNRAANEGGGLWNQTGSRLVLDNTVVRDNDAEVGGGVYVNGGRFDLRDGSRVRVNRADGDGGGIFVNDGTSYVEDSRVTRNDAGGTGGGAFLADDADLFVRDTLFARNDPNDIGGPGEIRGSDSGDFDRDGNQTRGDGDDDRDRDDDRDN